MNVVTSKQNKALVKNIDLSFFFSPPPELRWMKITTSATLTKWSKLFFKDISLILHKPEFFSFCFIIYFNFDPPKGKCMSE